MSLASLVHKSSQFLGFKIERTVSSFGNEFAGYGIKKDEYSLSGNTINLKKLNVTLPVGRSLPLLESYENALKLIDRGGAKFFIDGDNGLFVTIDQLTFRVNDEEELFILCEIFLEGSYNLLSPTKRPIALIDIGMNVGITSLFYAAQTQVARVFSYEPFGPTYKMARANVELNPFCATKITMNNFGLAKEESKMVVNFSLKQKGRMGLNGLPQKSDVITDNFSQESIALKPVHAEFSGIKQQVVDHFVVCKMDCEGAEYEIIDSLSNTALLSLPDVYFIEWHYKSPADIVKSLIDANYNVINTTFRSLNSGMIYAIKQ